MSEQASAPADAPRRGWVLDPQDILSVFVPIGIGLFAFWAAWNLQAAAGSGVMVLVFGFLPVPVHFAQATVTGLILSVSGLILVVCGGTVAWLRPRIANPQDYFGGLALIALALFALWASGDLPGMRGFSFGPGTAPRLFAIVLLIFGVIITAMAFFLEGKPLERYAIRGPLWITISIIIFATTVRPLGLIIATFVSFVVSGAGSPETRWVETIIAGVVMTAFSVLLFVYFLNLPFQLWPRF